MKPPHLAQRTLYSARMDMLELLYYYLIHTKNGGVRKKAKSLTRAFYTGTVTRNYMAETVFDVMVMFWLIMGAIIFTIMATDGNWV